MGGEQRAVHLPALRSPTGRQCPSPAPGARRRAAAPPRRSPKVKAYSRDSASTSGLGVAVLPALVTAVRPATIRPPARRRGPGRQELAVGQSAAGRRSGACSGGHQPGRSGAGGGAQSWLARSTSHAPCTVLTQSMPNAVRDHQHGQRQKRAHLRAGSRPPTRRPPGWPTRSGLKDAQPVGCPAQDGSKPPGNCRPRDHPPGSGKPGSRSPAPARWLLPRYPPRLPQPMPLTAIPPPGSPSGRSLSPGLGHAFAGKPWGIPGSGPRHHAAGDAHVRDTGTCESITGLRSQGVAWSSRLVRGWRREPLWGGPACLAP